MRKLLLLLSLLALTALTPQQKQLLLGYSPAAEEQFIAANSTLYLNDDVQYWQRENLVTYAEDLTQAVWTATDATKNSTTLFTVTAQNGRVRAGVAATVGATYEASLWIRAASGNTAIEIQHSGANNGSSVDYTSITATSTLTRYDITLTATSATFYVGVRDPNAAGFGQIEMTKVHVRRASLGHSPYVSTTTAAIYGLSATNTLGSWYPRVGSAPFVMATAANQPAKTAADDRENRIVSSEDISAANWSNVRATKISATELREDGTAANVHYLIQSVPVVAGQTVFLGVSVKRGTGSRNFVFYNDQLSGGLNVRANVNLGTGTVTSAGSTLTWASGPTVIVDPVDSSYWRVYGTVTTTVTTDLRMWLCLADATVNFVYNGDSTSSIHVTRMQHTPSYSPATYVTTGGYAIYRGQAGRAGVRFDGSNDVMTSAATLGDIFGASAKSFAMVLKPVSFQNNAVIWGDNTNWQCYTTLADSAIRCSNNDGSSDISVADNLTAGVPLVVVYDHDGTNQRIFVNGALKDQDASGATTSTAASLWLANTTSDYYGDVYSLVTDNSVWPASTRNRITKYLCRKYGADCQ